MNLTETIKLMSGSYESIIKDSMNLYIHTVNNLVNLGYRGTDIFRYSSKDIHSDLPSAIKNQCLRDAKSILKKHYKFCHQTVITNRKLIKHGSSKQVTAPNLPTLKKPVLFINNQNFRIFQNHIEFPLWINGKSVRITVPAIITERQLELFKDAKLGMLRVVYKNNKLVAQMSYEAVEPALSTSDTVMGVDLGIKCPAVSYTSDGHVRFYGNGRKNKYLRRHYDYLRRKAGKAKKPKVIKWIGDKENRIMNDIDHKLSREIVNETKRRGASVIKLEQLSNIRFSTRKSRKNNHSLHNWSFYRLAEYITYKARLAGIEVVFVNPAYTSQ